MLRYFPRHDSGIFLILILKLNRACIWCARSWWRRRWWWHLDSIYDVPESTPSTLEIFEPGIHITALRFWFNEIEPILGFKLTLLILRKNGTRISQCSKTYDCFSNLPDKNFNWSSTFATWSFVKFTRYVVFIGAYRCDFFSLYVPVFECEARV